MTFFVSYADSLSHHLYMNIIYVDTEKQTNTCVLAMNFRFIVKPSSYIVIIILITLLYFSIQS
jgi:hypothetical protein